MVRRKRLTPLHLQLKEIFATVPLVYVYGHIVRHEFACIQGVFSYAYMPSWVPFDRFNFDMWDNNPADDLTVLCGQLMIDNYGIQGRL